MIDENSPQANVPRNVGLELRPAYLQVLVIKLEYRERVEIFQ